MCINAKRNDWTVVGSEYQNIYYIVIFDWKFILTLVNFCLKCLEPIGLVVVLYKCAQFIN